MIVFSGTTAEIWATNSPFHVEAFGPVFLYKIGVCQRFAEIWIERQPVSRGIFRQAYAGEWFPERLDQDAELFLSVRSGVGCSDVKASG